MNFYKKIIPKRMRFAIAKFFSFVPDRAMLQIQYWIKFKRRLNLDNPKRYSEKLQWYKLNWRDPIMHICVDKYNVRDYIIGKGLSDILVELYAAYDKPEEIDLNILPDSFIMKTSNGSGTNIICKDKSSLDKNEVVSKFNAFFKQSDSNIGREWAYQNSSKKIIIEELLMDDDNSNGIDDYKIQCFNGKPVVIIVDRDRFVNHKRDFYDLDWNRLNVQSEYGNIDSVVERPANFERMIEIARILSKDFPAVRVDLYNIKGRIYFGELTFYPWSGYVPFSPDSFDFELGEKFVIDVSKKR